MRAHTHTTRAHAHTTDPCGVAATDTWARLSACWENECEIVYPIEGKDKNSVSSRAWFRAKEPIVEIGAALEPLPVADVERGVSDEEGSGDAAHHTSGTVGGNNGRQDGNGGGGDGDSSEGAAHATAIASARAVVAARGGRSRRATTGRGRGHGDRHKARQGSGARRTGGAYHSGQSWI